jgi:hypothetical protein
MMGSNKLGRLARIWERDLRTKIRSGVSVSGDSMWWIQSLDILSWIWLDQWWNSWGSGRHRGHLSGMREEPSFFKSWFR